MNTSYLTWNKKTIDDFSSASIEALYDSGYVFTRLGKGVAVETRSARINLAQFELTSENRRILKKAESVSLSLSPLPYGKYTWHIAKMGTDFYKARNAQFSAQKIKELMTSDASNFNSVFVFRNPSSDHEMQNEPLGYVIALETPTLVHYSYPFYKNENKDLGLAMMLQAILWAKENNKKYFYVGSLQRPSDTYKLQLSGIEWFDGKTWTNDITQAKEILKGVTTNNEKKVNTEEK